MCGRFNLRTSNAEFRRLFETDYSIPLTDRFNVAPTQLIPIVRIREGHREAVESSWGLVPFWVKEKGTSHPMINAKCETVATLPMFRSAFKSRRCLVPASGFYEWETHGKVKLPWHFTLKDQPLFAFAGLWEGKDEPTCTVLTTAANSMLERVHNRMPVILHPGEFEIWLAAGELPSDAAARLFEPFPADEMRESRANPYLNNARNEGPDCLVAPLNSA